jgi:hypothetical protein
MGETAKAIIIGSLIMGFSIIASTWIYTNNSTSTNLNNNNRYSLLDASHNSYEALKIDHKTGKGWFIEVTGNQIEVK